MLRNDSKSTLRAQDRGVHERAQLYERESQKHRGGYSGHWDPPLVERVSERVSFFDLARWMDRKRSPEAVCEKRVLCNLAYGEWRVALRHSGSGVVQCCVEYIGDAEMAIASVDVRFPDKVSRRAAQRTDSVVSMAREETAYGFQVFGSKHGRYAVSRDVGTLNELFRCSKRNPYNPSIMTLELEVLFYVPKHHSLTSYSMRNRSRGFSGRVFGGHDVCIRDCAGGLHPVSFYALCECSQVLCEILGFPADDSGSVPQTLLLDPGCTPESVERFSEFVNTNSCSLENTAVLLQLLDIANKYEIWRLSEVCQFALIRDLHEDDGSRAVFITDEAARVEASLLTQYVFERTKNAASGTKRAPDPCGERTARIGAGGMLATKRSRLRV